MTSLLSVLPFTFTSGAQVRPADHVSETEYQSIFAATALLLAGATAVCLVALSQAF